MPVGERSRRGLIPDNTLPTQSMPTLQRAVATLRISGDLLLPEEVSSLLGARPTRAHAKGQELALSSGRSRITKFGLWALSATDTTTGDIDAQVAEVLGRLSGDMTVWHDLGNRFEIDLLCGWFMGGGNEGVDISPHTLRALGARGIRLGMDLYGPDAEG